MFQIWQHKTSGESYAVEIEGGVVTEAQGPFYYKDLDAVIDLGYVPHPEPELADWVHEYQDDFRLTHTR